MKKPVKRCAACLKNRANRFRLCVECAKSHDSTTLDMLGSKKK